MGRLLRLLSPFPANFTEEDLERQDGRVFVITGAYSGVGLELAKILWEKGGKVYIVSRSQEKGDETIKRHFPSSVKGHEQQSRGTVTFIQMDLADLHSVERCAKEIHRLEEKVDMLFNMAGVGFSETITAQKYEPHIGVNCLGHYFLTQKLLPLLRNSAETSPKGSTRVIWSGAYYAKDRPKFAKRAIVDFVDAASRGTHSNEFGLYRYAVSKVVNWYMCLDLADREAVFRSDQAVSLTVNVGPLKTNIWKRAPWYVRFLVWPTLREPRQGAYTALFAGFHSSVGEQAGKAGGPGEHRFVVPWGHWCQDAPPDQVLEALQSGEPREVCRYFEKTIDSFVSSERSS